MKYNIRNRALFGFGVLSLLLNGSAFAIPVEVANAPSDNLDLTVSAIQSAQQTLNLNIYELDSPQIVDALLNRIQAGVKVQILEEGGPVGAFASPVCLDDNGQAMSVDDAQVLQWKVTTANQFLARAHVQGVISAIFPDENGHNHFAIDFDSNPSDNLEVVYNISFGALPTLKVGMTVEACGDYITSDQATAQYPVSPAGAIIHWIHRNPSGHGHPSGFLMINGTLYGQGNGDGS